MQWCIDFYYFLGKIRWPGRMRSSLLKWWEKEMLFLMLHLPTERCNFLKTSVKFHLYSTLWAYTHMVVRLTIMLSLTFSHSPFTNIFSSLKSDLVSRLTELFGISICLRGCYLILGAHKFSYWTISLDPSGKQFFTQKKNYGFFCSFIQKFLTIGLVIFQMILMKG